jgi:hypothetical protein
MSLTKPRAHQLLDLDFKQSCRVVTTTNITNLSTSSPSTVDGINLDRGDRVLVAGQNTASQNGIYRVSSVGTGSNGVWVRAQDFDTSAEVTGGIIITVIQGTANADSIWKLTTDDPITIGATSLAFSQVSTGTGGNSFGIIVAGSDNVEADQPGDTVTLTAGNNMVISGNTTTDTITLSVNANPTFTTVKGGNILLSGNSIFSSDTNGDITLDPNGSGDINVAAAVLPTTDGTLNLGSVSYKFGSLYLAGASLYLGNATFSEASNIVTINKGLTASGAINSTPIGNATASSGAFTSLTASSTVTLSPVSADVTLSPSSAGKVIINPATAGSVNNMVIGNVSSAAGTFTTLTSTSTTSLGATSATAINSTPIGNATASTGAFTTLTASSTVTLSPTSADVNLSPTVLGKVTIAPNTAGSINNMIIGNVTSAAGTFTTLTSTSTTSLGATSATAINNTPIGNSTASTGAFTTLTASNTVTLNPVSADVNISPSSTGKVVMAPAATGSINNMVIGNVTAAAATFTSLSASAINNTPIGNATASTGAFTTVTASSSTASTNTTTGAVIITGGLGVGGNINAGGNVKAGNVIVTGNLYYNTTTLVVRSLTVGTRTTPVSITLTASGSFNVLSRASGNVSVTTST